jgi:flagellar biosynthesis protein FlhB
MVIFNKGGDYKAGKIREAAQSNKIKVLEYKNS